MSKINKRDHTGTSDETIADGGRIATSPVAQTITAVAFLISVALVAFLGVIAIGPLIRANEGTYWLIELIFALLCGGAGALVGGSADVRSTLNIPGSPVKARLGGAIAMVLVGFAVAWLGKPKTNEEATYSVEIQNVRRTMDVDNVRYNVYMGPFDDYLSITRKGNLAIVTIPAKDQEYKANLTVFTSERDSVKIFVRCSLTFTSSTEPETTSTRQLLLDSDQRFRLYLSEASIEKAVHESIRTGHAIDNQPCIEGATPTERGKRKLLNPYITVVPISARTWLLNAAHLSISPPYAVMASAFAEDVPPTPLPTLGATPQQLQQTTQLLHSSIAAVQPSSAAVPPPPPAPPGSSTKAESSTTSSDGSPAPNAATPLTVKAQVDAYIRGEDLDRTQLYQSWNQVADYVVQGFRAAATSDSPLAARFVNLIANALNVADNGKYLAPTVRPNWDQSTKSDRLAKINAIPGFQADDYKNVVALICSSHAANRSAAQRLLRLFPSDNFYQSIQALAKQPSCDVVFASESAIYYFYNRIVEYDGTFPLDAASKNWIQGNYDDGAKWVKIASAQDTSRGIFSALLDYGYGIVLWDRSDVANQKTATTYFRSMLQTIGSSGGIYPSNPAHIATALNKSESPNSTSKTAGSAVAYNASQLRPIGGNYIANGTTISLFALPETASKQVGMANSSGSLRVYMRANNWDLVQAGPQIGWAQRTVVPGGATN
jgi:hypothetical protein